LRFHGVDNDMIVCWSKRTPNPDSADGPGDAGDGDVVLFVVNLDPMHVQSGWTALDLGALGVGDGDHFAVHDLLTDARYHWQGPNNFVALDPATVPAHVLAVHVEGRTGSAL
jgi:starch synthase (maltosyl-transferring)